MAVRLNIFVLGLDDLNLEVLEALPGADEMRFHGLLSHDDLLDIGHLDLPARLAEPSATSVTSTAASTRWWATGTSQ